MNVPTGISKPQQSKWPYEEAKFTKLSGLEQYKVETPWLSAQFEIKNDPNVVQALDSYVSGNLSHENLSSINLILENLKSLPIYYFLPRKIQDFGKDRHLCLKSMNMESPYKLVSSLGLLRSLELFPMDQAWAWDMNSIFSFSKVHEGTYDPVAILSVVRRFHYLDSADNDKTSGLYDFVNMLRSNPDQFRRACALIVRQNHYITQMCHEALRPALALSQSSEAKLDQFMEAEKDHDLILGRALTSLGFEPENVEVLNATESLMKMLRTCAETNFMAFAMAMDLFEKPQIRSMHSLAEVLMNGNFETAARCLQKHKDIIDTGEHESISVELLSPMVPVSRVYVEQAVRLVETLSHIMNQVSANIYSSVRELM